MTMTLLLLTFSIGQMWGASTTYTYTGYTTQIANGWTHNYGDTYVGRKGSNYTPDNGGLPTGNSNIFAAFQVSAKSKIRVVFVWTKTNGDLSDKSVALASLSEETYNKLVTASTGTGNDVKYSISNFSSSQSKAVAINRADANKEITFEFDDAVSAGYYAVYTASSINASALIKKIIVVPTHTLTWDFDGGSSSATAGEDYTAGGDVAEGATITYPVASTMSKSGSEFNGWSSSATTMPTTNLTITAQWTAASSCAATIPGNITKGTASGGTGIITLTAGGDIASGDTWYWQDAADGTATDKGSGATKNVSATGTYYIRSYNATGTCWSAAKSVTVAEADLLTAINPTLSYAANVFVGGTLSPTLEGNTGSGSVSYELNDVTPAGCMTIDEAGVVTAVAPGTATVTATITKSGYYAGNTATSGTITVIAAPTHMVENRLVITNGASWGSSIYTTDGTNITNLSAFNPSRTGDGAINVNKKTANGSRSTNISSYTSENADNYMVLSFTVADGKRLRVSAVNIQPFSVSDTKHHRAWLANADGNKIVEATAELDKDACENVFANIDFSENAVYLTGTNYLKLWTWGSTNGYRLNTPIYIDGVISDIPATYSVTYVPNNGVTPAETMTDSNSPYEASAEVTLLSNTFTAPSGKLFDGWVATYNDGENDHELTITNGKFTMPAYNVTVTARWADATATYDITYVSDHGTAPDAENAASVVLAELSESGWQHVGWTADVDVTVDAETVTAGTLIANGKTAILSADVEFTAVWNQIYTVTYNANGGSCATTQATWKAGDEALVLPAATKDNFDFVGWYDAAVGGNKIASPYTPSASIELFAHYMPKLVQAIYSNTFDAFIKNQAVTVFYLQGESEPTLTSIKVLGVETPVFEEVDGNIKVTIETVDYIFPVTKTAVAPYAGTGEKETFDGTETYVKTGNAFSTESGKLGWKFSKTDNDWSREADGRTRLYFFLGAAEEIAFENGGTARNIKVYRNGVELTSPTSSGNAVIAGTSTPAMYAVVSNQTSGDGSIKSMTLAPWVPVTAVALKEGTTPISEKEIWASASFTLTAEVTPDNASNKTITWTSSNEAIATVTDGVVTGVAANASPVTITASTVDGVTATCAVTVTAAPEPSADPVITAQPASANYYEGATIAALEVVATGESLSYQWYLGSDAISGAESATYTPTVSAIGSYVYHCVVTNTEAGKLPTSLASSNATITIAEDPTAIKLINKSTGAINTTNFITGVTANDNVHGENGAIFGSSSSNASVKGLSGLNKVVVYNATTTQTKIKLVLYNTNSAAQEVVLSTMAEGDVDPVGQAISVPSKELYSTGYITYNSTKNRTFYLHTKSTNVQISQIQVIESGDELAVAGKKDYSLNLNKGRVYAYASTAQTWEGLSMNLGSNYSPATTEYITFKDNALSFSVPNDVCLTITPARAGDKYYVTDVADGTDNATTTVAGTPNSFDLTGGVGKVWYIRSQGSNVQLTNIAFSAPKCAEPAITPMTNVDLCEGDAFTPITVTATVSDEGTLHYAWFKEAGATDEAVGTDAATYTPTADGQYYVVVTNQKENFSDNSKTSNTISVTHFGAAVITTAPLNQRGEVGDVVTLTVAATGKNVSYKWYTCDEDGSNEVALDPAETGTSLNVTITDGMLQWYKVKVTSDCGGAEAKAKVSEFEPTTPANVTTSILWDWTSASWPASGEVAFSNTDASAPYELLADADAIVPNNEGFSSDMLYGKGQWVWRSNNKFFQGTAIKFSSTVAGKVRVYFRSTGSGNTVNVAINGTAAGSRTNSFGWSSYVDVPAGEVEILCSGDGYTRIQKIEFQAIIHQRTTGYAAGDLGTVCLEDATIIDGANLYELAGLDQYGYMAFDQILSGELEAGKPYLFEVTNPSKISFYKPVGAAHSDDEIAVKGMIGTFAGTTLYQNVAQNYYYFSGRHIWRVNDFTVEIPIPAHRCYVDMDALKNAVASPSPLPGRRRVTLGVNGKNAPTAIDNAEATEAPRKVMINGTLFILRGEKMYDATGRLVK